MVKACYIAGPMRGIPKYNYPAFFAAQEALEKHGWLVFNPAAMDEPDDEDYEAHTLSDQKLHDTASACRRFAIRDLGVITHELRAEEGDAVVVLPGYGNSVGATAEVAVARLVKLRVITIAEALNDESAKADQAEE